MTKNRIPAPQVTYHDFKLNKIRQPQYRHLLYLLFWPVFILRYLVVEHIPPLGPYHVMYCPLDDRIPFCEFFLIPYGLWFVCLAAMTVYTMFYDVKEFRRFLRFMILSVCISTATFILYPSCQNLRPEIFPRDNFLTDIMRFVYWFDTSTNVCPSEHVIGSFAVVAAAFHCKGLRSPGKLAAVCLVMAAVSVSTVFLKQHSVVDILAAVPVCIAVYFIVYRKKKA